MKRSFEEKEKKITQSQEPLKTLMAGYTSTFLYVAFIKKINKHQHHPVTHCVLFTTTAIIP